MTVRNCSLWVAVAIATTACAITDPHVTGGDAGIQAAPGVPVMLSRSGRGVAPELPPIPPVRSVARVDPPLPASRPVRAKPGAPADVRPPADAAGGDAPAVDNEAETVIGLGEDPIDEPLFEPKKFYGMSADGVRTLLGPPQMVFERPPSTVWHYRDGRCELDLYLYLDVASGQFRVATFNLSPHKEDAALRHETRCLKRLRIAYHAT